MGKQRFRACIVPCRTDFGRGTPRERSRKGRIADISVSKVELVQEVEWRSLSQGDVGNYPVVSRSACLPPARHAEVPGPLAAASSSKLGVSVRARLLCGERLTFCLGAYP